jgi:ABC-type uncharacterized transport system permease subunit
MNKINSIAITTFSIALFVKLLNSSDRISDFLPLLESVKGKHITTYDFFLILIVITFRIFFTHFGINKKTLQQLFQNFCHSSKMEFLGMAVAGLSAYFIINPFLFGIFRRLIADIQTAPDGIRKACVALIPFVWVLITAIMNKISGNYQAPYQGNYPNYPNMPPPP